MTRIYGVENTVHTGSPVFWTVQTFDASNNPLAHGGEMLHAAVEGPALLRPSVFDLRNGTYIVAFTAFDAGRYKAKLTLRWPSCTAYVFCSAEDTFQPIEEVGVVEFVAIDVNTKNSTIAPHYGNHYAAGRWVASREQQGDHKYIWHPFSGENTLKKKFPTENLRGRWIYFVGDSLSEHAFDQLIREILPLSSNATLHELVNRFDGSSMQEQYKRDAMQLYYLGDLNLTMAFTFFPDSAPVGGFKSTRFPLINETTNSIDAAHNVTFVLSHWVEMLHKAMKRHPEIPAFAYPDAVVFNFGLHYAAPLDPPLYTVLLRHMLMALHSEFPSNSTKIFWRSTAYTHFEKEELAMNWNCRTPVKTEIMNEISDKLVQAAGLETLDFQALTAARADATPDNRHFSLGNVRETYNSILLNRLNELWKN